MRARHATGSLRTFDGLTLFTQRWLPPDETPETPARTAPRAAVLVVHGLAEHSGRYASLARHLAGRGYAVFAYDHRGHGASHGPRAYVHNFDAYVADLHRAHRHVEAQTGGAPLFLMGHSMGGAVAALYVLDHGARPAGLILSSPTLRVTGGLSPALRRLAGPVGRWLPHLPTLAVDPRARSRDPETRRAFEADPLCYKGPVPARLGAEMLRAGRRIRARMDRLTCPLLVLQGTADRLVDPEAGRALYHCARSGDKALLLYEGFYHETLNEPERAHVHADLATWLDAHASLGRLTTDG